MFQLKDYVSVSFISRVSTVLQEVAINFDKKKFKTLVFDDDWDRKGLKQRTHHVAKILRTVLIDDYKIASKQLIEIAKGLEKVEFRHETIGLLCVPDFIEDYGVLDFENSMKAIEQVTKLMSCEFAVRPFFKMYPEEMCNQAIKWAKDDDFRVRRLASEGSRSRLPWATSVAFLKDNPFKVLNLLKLLYDDENEGVRLSVSNNLNDISKDYPDIVLDFAKQKIGESKKTDRMLKHALRTLLKNGNETALQLFGYVFSQQIKVDNFKVSSNKIMIGEDLEFAFHIKNTGNKIEKVRIEYVIYYKKSKGILSPKIYQIGEKELKPNSSIKIKRKRSFKIISTRKFYFGQHKIAIIINGQEVKSAVFELVI